MVEKTTALATVEPRRATIVVEDPVPVFDTATFEHMSRVALAMGKASLMPKHLRGANTEEAIANAFLIVNMAYQLKVDPFRLAQSSYELHGKIGFEGKLMHAVVERLVGQGFEFEYTGSGDNREITVTNRRRIDGTVRSIRGTVGQWKTYEKDGKTVKGNWRLDPDKQLRYRGIMEWARAWEPGVITGVMTDDELSNLEEQFDERQKGRQYLTTEIPSAKMPATIEGEVRQDSGKSDIRQTGAAYSGVDKPNDDPPEQVRARAESEARQEGYGGEIAGARAHAQREFAKANPPAEIIDAETGEVTDDAVDKSADNSGSVAESTAQPVDGTPEDEKAWGPDDWIRNHEAFRDGMPGVKTEQELMDLLETHDVDGMPEQWSTAMQNLFNDKMEAIRAAAAKPAQTGEAKKPASAEPATKPKHSFDLVRSQLRQAESAKEVEGIWSAKVAGQPYPADQANELKTIRADKLKSFGAAAPQKPTITRMRANIEAARPTEGETAAVCLDRVWAEWVKPWEQELDAEDVEALRVAAVARGKELAKAKRAAAKAKQGDANA
jgi:hypothetical protein